MKRLFGIFDLSKNEQRVVLIVMLVLVALCFGFIFGILAFRKANEALETISIYEVAQEKRGLAQAAKILGIIDIIFWVLALVARIALR